MNHKSQPSNILVTGGAGFIGSNLVRYLLNTELTLEMGLTVGKVVNLDKMTYAGNSNNLSDLRDDNRHIVIQGDICDRELVDHLLDNHSIDAIMHLAAESHVDRSIEDASAFIQTNVVGTHCLLEAFRQYRAVQQIRKPNTGRFLHVSTDEVYGSLGADDPPFSESTAYAPNSPYSASKAASDHFTRAYFHTYGLPVITTNCSNNYGPRQFPEKLIPLMIRKTLKGESLPVYGDGSNVRDWLFVDDHCRGLVLALSQGVIGQTYVLGGNCEMKNIDIVRAIISAVKEIAPNKVPGDLERRITFVKDRPGHDQRYAINCNRIKTDLGWAPRESFASGLRKTVQWYVDNENWIDAIEDGSYRGERLRI